MSDVKPTYCYAMLMRPPAPGALPGKGLVHVDCNEGETLKGHHYWGIALYDRQLSKDEMEHYDMEVY